MMKTKGYCYSSSSSVSSSAGSRNHSVSPMTSPKESILMRYLRSGLLSDLDYSPSPKQSRPIINYHNNIIISSSNSCRSPLSVVENFEDNVIVMDGILVDSNKISRSAAKFRNSTVNSDSSSISAANLYKTELCMSWENSGTCRYGHKCQKAHGQEERLPITRRPLYDADLESHYSPLSSMYSSGSGKFAFETMTTPSPAKEAAYSKFKKALSTQSKDALTFNISDPYDSPLSSTHNSSSSKFASKTMATPPTKEATYSKFSEALPIQSKNAPTVSPNLTGTDWCPLDDGIAVNSTSSRNITLSRETVNQHIHSVLYSPTQKKRLPVFVDICPKQWLSFLNCSM